MDIPELVALFSSVGASAFGVIKYATSKLEVYREQSRLEREAERQERVQRDERMLNQLDEMTKTNQTLLANNKELAEGQRVLLNEHSVKINNIENTVIVMSEKLDNRLNLKKGNQNGN